MNDRVVIRFRREGAALSPSIALPPVGDLYAPGERQLNDLLAVLRRHFGEPIGAPDSPPVTIAPRSRRRA